MTFVFTFSYLLVFCLLPISFPPLIQLAMCKRGEKNPLLYELDGPEALGSILRILPSSDNAPEISEFSVQWYRLSSDGGKKELISGMYFYIRQISL